MSTPPAVVADRYRLIAPLGQGGMGRVWRATDVVLHREVAIKELVPPPGLTPDERQEMRERSLREARAIARLNNINVVRVFDVLRTDADPWIVMEYVASRSLHDILASDGPYPPVRAAEIGLGVLNALRAAHRAGVVHRDVKPGNVLIAEDGRVVLTDFGLATVPGDPNVTRTGLVLGSPAYIAPERARDGTAGPGSDLWGLGATLYAAVEGASPFARPSAIATLAALATENPPPARNAGPLKPVLNGLLRKDPAHRIDGDEAERLLLRALGRKSRIAFAPMSPTTRRPGVGRERPAPSTPPVIPGPNQGASSVAASAPVVPGPRPPASPVSPGRPPVGPSVAPGGGRAPVYAPGKASVGKAAPTNPEAAPTNGAAAPSTRGAAPAAQDAAPTNPESAAATGAAATAQGTGHRTVVPEGDAGAADQGLPETAVAAAGVVDDAVPGADQQTSTTATGTSTADDYLTDATTKVDNARSRSVSSATASAPTLGGGVPAARAGKNRAGIAGGVARTTVIGAGVGGAVSSTGFNRTGSSTRPPWQGPPMRAASSGSAGVPVLMATLSQRRTVLWIAVVAAIVLGVGLLLPLVFAGDDTPKPGQGAAPTAGAGPAVLPPAASAAAPTSAASSATASPTPSATPSATPDGELKLPAGWRIHRDSTGFSVPVPGSWDVERKRDEVYFRERGNGGRVLIIGWTDQPKSDPVKDWKQQESRRKGGYSNYHRISINAVPYFQKAADWQFTYDTSSGNAQRVNKRGFVVSKRQAYGIHWSTSPEDWDDNRDELALIYQGFKPASR